jgi:hypothetical protein
MKVNRQEKEGMNVLAQKLNVLRLTRRRDAVQEST